MKKVLIGSTLAIGLLLSGAGQAPASANSTGLNVGGINKSSIDIQAMDLETALMAVQSQRAALLDAQIDSMNNSQQMDMLRLQSMSNKRNEAFDEMSNFLKKMQDARSSIIDNMR
ncbi:hypothetical protein AEA09_07055 [Lysinibacillus contaminans]|uniref:Secreted protein n=1 Tax=Lysinibacillus contaminans TaxID=1293441 RepID=A0ABR5K0R7_9BACI|nr:hypothetical protein [Lysinibacillus contaminans]KOS68337.1 hypothetical protein AEA09_07055 [Lysinibacillus contaminans]